MSKSTFEILKKLGNFSSRKNAHLEVSHLQEPQLKLDPGYDMGEKLAELLRNNLAKQYTPMD
ncbi:MAG: hypothetical protein CK426_00835 [Legionella sp.]|nr:MAG: hypothetical protein CK423_02125 [Legionella sp.]PJE00085.1 MAG: hypothetical protein CK426_00835 [Legionella sp.]